jgi:SHS2 domain-containing protein
MSFEEIEHTADRAFRVRGRDLAELLENAALAMRALDGHGPGGEPSLTREIEVMGMDRESLLVNWLNEILFLEQTQGLACERFRIWEIKGDRLRAQIAARERKGNHSQVKAATFHNLQVRQTDQGLEAEVVLDV